MIIDIGGGTTEVAVISLGGIVSWGSVRMGGDKVDQAVMSYIKNKHSLAIGERTAEEIKMNLGSALKLKKEKEIEIQGRDLIAGLPKTIIITSSEITEAIQDQLGEIIQVIKAVLRETPPELSADVMNKGMVLSGGGALLKNLDRLISKVTGVACYMADKPLLCVAKGTGIALENLEIYKKSIVSRK